MTPPPPTLAATLVVAIGNGSIPFTAYGSIPFTGYGSIPVIGYGSIPATGYWFIPGYITPAGSDLGTFKTKLSSLLREGVSKAASPSSVSATGIAEGRGGGGPKEGKTAGRGAAGFPGTPFAGMGGAGVGKGGSEGVTGTGLGACSALVGDTGPSVCASVLAAVCDDDVCSSTVGGSVSLGGENRSVVI